MHKMAFAHVFVPEKKNGFGPFSYKFFVCIRVGLTFRFVVSASFVSAGIFVSARHFSEGTRYQSSPIFLSPSLWPSSLLPMPEIIQVLICSHTVSVVQHAFSLMCLLLSQNRGLYHIGSNTPKFGTYTQIVMASQLRSYCGKY